MEGGLIIVPVTWEVVRVLGHENQGDGAESRGNHMEPGGHAITWSLVDGYEPVHLKTCICANVKCILVTCKFQNVAR